MNHKAIKPTLSEEDDPTRLIERPEGFYWQNKFTEKLHGPFATMAEAMEEAGYQEEEAYEGGSLLLEAEDELGIANWIDPDTGELAEGSIPHFND